MIGLAVPPVAIAPGLHVAVYPVIGDPPVLAGAVKLTWMPPCTCTAVTPVGAPGGVASTSNGLLRPPVSASPLVRLALRSAPTCAVFDGRAGDRAGVRSPRRSCMSSCRRARRGRRGPARCRARAHRRGRVADVAALDDDVECRADGDRVAAVHARDREPRRRPDDEDARRERPRAHRAVAELAFVVLAPAHHADLGDHRARVILAGRDRRHAAREAAHVDRRRTLRRRAVAELAAGVESPALDAAGRRQRAGVREARRDRGDAARQAR